MFFLKKWIINLLIDETKASRTAFLSDGRSTGASWSNRRYDIFAKESYLKNVIAFRCITEISKEVSSVEWDIFNTTTDNKRQRVEQHDLRPLLTRANPQEGFSFLIYKLIAYLLLAGNSFLERVAPDTGPNKNTPKELYILRPDKITINVNKNTGELAGYTFTNNGQDVSWEVDPITLQSDVLQFKTFNPLDDWWGTAFVEPAAREIDTSNEGIEWNKKLLENEARPGMLFTVIGNMSDTEFERLERQLKADHSGAENAGNNLILEGDKGTTAAPYGFSPRDMDWKEGDLATARKICMSFGVPPMIVGIPGEATFANFKEARLSFWENTVLWWLKYLKDELNNWFFMEEEATFLDYNLEDVPALAPRRDALWDRAQKADFLMVNEKRNMVGLDEIDGGNVIMAPATQVPILGEDADEIDSDDLNDEEGAEGEED